MSNVKNENYTVIQGFMVSELNLKGNELLIYAIIYGFSQLEGQEFNGTLQYLADWCNATKQGVIKCLNSLIEKGLIEKQEAILNNVKFISYHTTKFNTIKQSLTGIKQSLTGGIKQSLTIDNINNNNINNNIYKENKKEKIDEIVNYLNLKTGKHYRSNGKTAEFIEARLKEDYTIEDFKHVIDVKCEQWLGSEMETYLRPETLFNRTKFESYLNEKIKDNDPELLNGGFETLNDIETSIDDDIEFCKKYPEKSEQYLNGLKSYNPEREQKIREALKGGL